MEFDIIIIGSGPGGYVAAIRASQLGMKTALVEMAEIGGICLNWGCIPTKALLKSAQVYQYLKHAENYGININAENFTPNLEAMVQRSRSVADGMSKGVSYLIKKNNITLINGRGKVLPNKQVEVTAPNSEKTIYNTKHIIIASGARSRQLEGMEQDGDKIIGYRDALTLKKQPASMLVIGSGAIGSEFAYFYNSIGTKVTLVEYMPEIVPLEDEEVSKQLARSFKKAGIKIMTSASVTDIDKSGELCKVTVKTAKGEEIIEVATVLSAVGITPNTENIGLDECGIKTDKGKILVDEFYKTKIEGYYAIGDVIPGPALAHVASHEAIICVENIAGKSPEPLNYKNIPACTYTQPEIASTGFTEKAAIEAGYEVKVGKFPLTASGKASAAGEKDGFIKVIFDAKYGELLGVHMIGASVTEIVGGAVIARNLEITGEELIKTIFPHPTISESLMEAAAAAYGEAIHI